LQDQLQGLAGILSQQPSLRVGVQMEIGDLKDAQGFAGPGRGPGSLSGGHW
jgi:hypothetical protein